MKKLLDSRFLFIVLLSVIVLMILVVGAFYLFNNNEDTFIKSGYVLNPLSSVSEKYFFNEDTGYRENLSRMVEFKDVDDNDVSVLRDSFLHYNDGSISFLNKGAILDLGGLGASTVPFYNIITSKSIIQNKKGNYIIKASGEDIVLNNFIGRISDDKYIFVGKLELKIPGNDKLISGDYFEVVYTDEGIVNIENKDVKYQVMAEGTVIYAGNNIAIDLGTKGISKNDENVMSITAITINGDENIEIVPEVLPEEEDEDGDGEGSDGNGEGSGGTGNSNVIVERTEDIIVSLKDATVGSTYVDLIFDMYNNTEEDKFNLKVTNLESGYTVDIIEGIEADEEVIVNLLSPDTKYLFTIINEKDDNKYFQKIFETSDFGIELTRLYSTDSSMLFAVKIGEDTEVNSVNLTLYQYNEETSKLEPVKIKITDANTGEEKYIERTAKITSSEGKLSGAYEIPFDGLDSNTIYTAVLDEFSVASSNFKDVYNISLTSMTLKKTPVFSNMQVSKNAGAGSFSLSLGGIEDEDNAIVSYKYLIYDASDDSEPVIPEIVKSNAAPVEVKIGNGKDQLKNDTNYYYRTIIEYYDNEKYIEYIMDDVINFVMGNDPFITVVADNSNIGYDSFEATIYLTDNSCLVSMPGREKCMGASTTVVEVSRINPINGNKELVPGFPKLVDFEVSENDIKYELVANNLHPGTTYAIEVRAVMNNDNGGDNLPVVIKHTEESKERITTKSLTNFVVDWNDKGSATANAINLETQLVPQEGTGTMNADDTAEAIKKVVVKLYEGDYVDELEVREPIATKVFRNTEEFNIKQNFYDGVYPINTTDTFGLDLAGLKALSTDGKLSERYTIAMYGYYDNNELNEVSLSNNIVVYKISALLLMDNIEEPVLEITPPITKKQSGKFQYLLNDGTIVGFPVMAAFDRQGLLANSLTPENINIYVYDSNGERVSFLIDNGGALQEVESIHAPLEDKNYYETKIYMDYYGTEYGVADTSMKRGGTYYIGYDIEVSTGSETLLYPENGDENAPARYGVFKKAATEKETPLLKMYIYETDEESITYKYEIKDPDKALYRDSLESDYYFYYKINDGEEQTLTINPTPGVNNQYSGEVTIHGLSNGDVYQIYYKKNATKTGEYAADVYDYLDGEDNGRRKFDGYYDLKEAKYNFSFEVINNPLIDNKVTIKMLPNKDILDRVVSYKVNFRDTKGNSLDKEEWKLNVCDGDEDGAVPRCLYFDYVDLKNAGMKSDRNVENMITVSVQALYDNGLTGFYYYENGSTYKENYPYMIFQNNLTTANNSGAYISMTKEGNIAVWSELLDIGKGYYESRRIGSTSLTYISRYNSTNVKNINYSLSGSGYVSNYGTLNPKMISIDPMTSSKNTFSFNSITPKVTVDRTTPIINGAVVDLKLSGADIEDFCNDTDGDECINEANSDFYIYIDVWNNDEYIGDLFQTIRPTLKIKINKTNTTEPLEGKIDLLAASNTYYYNIYAYLNKDGRRTYTQLFDGGYKDTYQTKSYSFTALAANDIFHNYEVTYKADTNANYGNRLMTTKVNLFTYANGVPFNYDVQYALCQVDDDNCGIEEWNSNIFTSTIAVENMAATVTDTVDITQYDLEFGKGYYMYIYAVFDRYESSNKTYLKEKLILNRRTIYQTLRPLEVPEFVVSRSADIVDGDYVLDFTINVNDPDRTLLNGEYFVKLVDAATSQVKGNLLLKNRDGDYVTIGTNGNYVNYAFNAATKNTTIRISGLEEATKYSIVVYNRAYINNYSAEIPKSERTIDIVRSHTVYTTNSYGVAFGNDVDFIATETSVVLTFSGGSNFNNVTYATYTVGLWEGGDDDTTATGEYDLVNGNKKFEMYSDTGEWRFVITPELTIVEGKRYYVIVTFTVKNSVTNELTEHTFSGYATYIKDIEEGKKN